MKNRLRAKGLNRIQLLVYLVAFTLAITAFFTEEVMTGVYMFFMAFLLIILSDILRRQM